MEEYLKHIIFHLNKYGNAYFPKRRIDEFTAFGILKALRKRGFKCEIRYFTDALADERSLRNGKIKPEDAVIILTKEKNR